MPKQADLGVDAEEARITNGFIHRKVGEINRALEGLDPDIRLIVIARVQRDTIGMISDIEIAAALTKRQRGA